MCFSCRCEEMVEELAALEGRPEFALLRQYKDLAKRARELITPNHGDSDVVPQSKD